MEEEEPSELKKPAAGKKEGLEEGPAEQEGTARRLREFYLELEQRNLFQCLGLDRRLYELMPVDDDERLFHFFLAGPFGLVTEIALADGCGFG